MVKCDHYTLNLAVGSYKRCKKKAVKKIDDKNWCKDCAVRYRNNELRWGRDVKVTDLEQ